MVSPIKSCTQVLVGKVQHCTSEIPEHVFMQMLSNGKPLSTRGHILQGDHGLEQWSSEYLNEPRNDWADEFSHKQAQADRQADGQNASTATKSMEQTRALCDTLASSQDPKLRQSKFLQFVSKMSRGEIILEDNQVAPHLVTKMH